MCNFEGEKATSGHADSALLHSRGDSYSNLLQTHCLFSFLTSQASAAGNQGMLMKWFIMELTGFPNSKGTVQQKKNGLFLHQQHLEDH